MSTENENNESGTLPEGAEPDVTLGEDGTVAQAAAHLIGVSMPQDEHHASYTQSERDNMTDEDLRAMGVEPDSGPTPKLILTFVALVVAIIVVGVAVGMMYRGVSDIFVAAGATGDDDRLTALHEESRAVLGEFASVDETVSAATEETPAVMRTVYRVPVDMGMDMLVNDPSLLDMHWLGAQSAQIESDTEPVIEREVTGIEEGSGTALPTTLVDPSGAPTGAVVVDPHAGHNHAAGDHTGHGH